MNLLLSFLLSVITHAQPIQLEKGNVFFLFSDIDEQNTLQTLLHYQSLRQQNSGDLYLVIHSPGGSIEAANMLIKAFQADKKLHAVVVWAASAAACVSQLVGGQTYIVPRGQLMFHNPRYIFNRPVTFTIEDAFEMHQDLLRTTAVFAQLCNSRMKLPSYVNKVKDDWFLNSRQAAAHNAAKVQQFVCGPQFLQIKATVPTYDLLTGAPTPTHICNLLQN